MADTRKALKAAELAFMITYEEKRMAELGGQLMSIGEVAAKNIAVALKLSESKVKVIEQAIKDEISAMSSHFTLAIADVQTSYEVELAKIKSEWSFVKANPVAVSLVASAVFVFGVLIGHVA